MSTALFDLTGRTALVTGSSRGLGRAMAEGLAEAGAAVVLNGADAGRLAAAAAALRALGHTAHEARFDGWVKGRTPARRWGRPDELIGTVVFLASAASDYVNGQIIYVDGGMISVL